MSPARPHPFRWLPPFLVGMSAAVAAEVALALLLYDGPGLTRSLTTVLVVEALALSLGLWAVPVSGRDAVEALRRRWLFCMVVFLGATLFSAFWSLIQRVGEGGLGQGIGLAAMGALPLYACGTVLAGMSAVEREHPVGRTERLAGAAALGAAVGFLATGLALPRILTPASLYLSCLVLLSAGGLVYGAALDRRLRVRVRARRPSATGEVRVEDRRAAGGDAEVRVLVEGPWIRSWSHGGEGGGLPWDVAVHRAVAVARPADGPPMRVLLVGGGASLLPRTAVRENPDVRVDVVERSLTVVEVAREHLDTELEPGVRDRIRVWVGNVEDLLEDLEDGYDLVLVDTTSFRTVGGVETLSRDGRAALVACVGPDGLLALGPVAPEPRSWGPAPGWRRTRVRLRPSSVVGVVQDDPGPREEVVLLARSDPPLDPTELGEVVEAGQVAGPPVAEGAGEAGGSAEAAP